MRSGIQYILILWSVFALFTGCSKQEVAPDTETADVTVTLFGNDGIPSSRALGDTAVHTVDRILVLPFQKLNTALPDANAANFVPAYSFAKQFDVASSFPLTATLKLPVKFTYKVLVIGYNHQDYDFNQPNASANRFTIGSETLPTTLANFELYPKVPVQVPEFFTCICSASSGSTVLGNVFTVPQTGTLNLSGTLGRIVSGLYVQVSNIPAFVTSMTLVAENMVKAIQVNDTLASVVQQPGDGANRVIRKKTPVAGKVTFSELLLPTMDTYKTFFYLDVKYGLVTERYTIRVGDSAVSNGNRIRLFPNRVVRITGSYLNINLGFEISCSINLDDDQWDGII